MVSKVNNNSSAARYLESPFAYSFHNCAKRSFFPASISLFNNQYPSNPKCNRQLMKNQVNRVVEVTFLDTKRQLMTENKVSAENIPPTVISNSVVDMSFGM